MAYTFADLKNELKRRGTVDQSGSQFDTAVENLLNTSIFRISREGLWRSLRRKTTFDTIGTYTTGTGGGTFTNASKSITMVGATWLTDNIQPGRRIKLQGESDVLTILTITGETTLTVDKNYTGTTISGTGTYSILGQEEYNLPVQSTHKLFLWHEEYGYPYQLQYIPDQKFFKLGFDNTDENTPIAYRMWGEDMIREQVKAASVMTLSSSSSSDTNKEVVIYGIVSNLPDSEVITTNANNGTTAVNGSKSFSSVERAVIGASTIGRITITANSTNTTVIVLPTGDTTATILYRKIQLYPLPDNVFPINVFYYKDPFRLTRDSDVHELGQAFDEAIILLATSKIKFEQNQKEAKDFFSLYKDEVNSLKKTNADKIDWFPTLERSQQQNSGQLVHPYLLTRQIGSRFGLRVHR